MKRALFLVPEGVDFPADIGDFVAPMPGSNAQDGQIIVDALLKDDVDPASLPWPLLGQWEWEWKEQIFYEHDYAVEEEILSRIGSPEEFYETHNWAGCPSILGEKIRVPDPLQTHVNVAHFGTDQQAVEAAVQEAVSKNKSLLFPDGYTFTFKNIWLPYKPGGWHILAHGAILQHPDTSPSLDAMFYTTCLTGRGGSSRATPYGQRVYFWGGTLQGQGHGIGFKSFIVAGPKFIGVQFKDLGTSVKTMGTTGMAFKDCGFANAADYHIHMARNASDPDSENYLDETWGWNDGVSISGNGFAHARKNIFHEGSNSEGVIAIRDNIINAGTEAGIELVASMTSVLIESNWTEFYTGADTDLVRLLKDPLNGYESRGPCTIRHNHFYNSPNDTIGYGVYSEWANVEIDNNQFQLTDSGCKGAIFNRSSVSRSFEPSASVLTPTNIDPILGEVSLTESELPGHYKDGYYMTADGVEYFLNFKSRVGGVATYTVHKITKVYSEQFPAYGPNWLNVSRVSDKVHPIGMSVDLDNPTTAFTIGATVEIWNAMNGGVKDRSLMRVRNNMPSSGLSKEKFYQQEQWGMSILENNGNYG